MRRELDFTNLSDVLRRCADTLEGLSLSYEDNSESIEAIVTLATIAASIRSIANEAGGFAEDLRNSLSVEHRWMVPKPGREEGWHWIVGELRKDLTLMEVERDKLLAIVRELSRRCEKVAKVTTDPDAYKLLNDAAWKAERAVLDVAAPDQEETT